MNENIPESCAKCYKYIYKGEDEAYCQAAGMREVWLKGWQRKPKWCPIERKWREQKNESDA